MEKPDRICACPSCGGACVPKKTLDGSRYFIALSNSALQEWMTANSADEFVRDRLQRAEKIIIDLRAEVARLKNDR